MLFQITKSDGSTQFVNTSDFPSLAAAMTAAGLESSIGNEVTAIHAVGAFGKLTPSGLTKDSNLSAVATSTGSGIGDASEDGFTKGQQYATAGAVEEEDTLAGILSGLQSAGMDTNRNTIGGRFNRNFSGDILNTFKFADILSGIGKTDQLGIEGLLDPDTVGRLEDFTRHRGGSRSGIRGQADSILSQLRNPADPESIGVHTSANLQALSDMFNQPNQGQASALGGLAGTALANHISPLSMDLLNLPSGGSVRSDFLAGGGEGDFLDQLLKSYYLT